MLIHIAAYLFISCLAGSFKRRKRCSAVTSADTEMIALLLDQFYFKATFAPANNYIGTHIRCFSSRTIIARVGPIGMSRKRVEVGADIETGLADLVLWYL